VAEDYPPRQRPDPEGTTVRNAPQRPSTVVPGAQLGLKPGHERKRLKERRQQQPVARPPPGDPRKNDTEAAGQKGRPGASQYQSKKGKGPRGPPAGINDSEGDHLGIEDAARLAGTQNQLFDILRRVGGIGVGVVFVVAIAIVVVVVVVVVIVVKFPIGIKAQLERSDRIRGGVGRIELVYNRTGHDGVVAPVALPQAGKPTGARQEDQE